MRAESAATFIDADPYPWPYNGDLRPANTALIVIDMQTDFCGVGSYVDKMGYDLALTRAPLAMIAAQGGDRGLAHTQRNAARSTRRSVRPGADESGCHHLRRRR